MIVDEDLKEKSLDKDEKQLILDQAVNQEQHNMHQDRNNKQPDSYAAVIQGQIIVDEDESLDENEGNSFFSTNYVLSKTYSTAWYMLFFIWFQTYLKNVSYIHVSALGSFPFRSDSGENIFPINWDLHKIYIKHRKQLYWGRHRHKRDTQFLEKFIFPDNIFNFFSYVSRW